jgi:hypothetical protein
MINSKRLQEIMKDVNPEALKVDGFDDCICGIVHTFYGAVFVYNVEDMINEMILQGMTEEEAEEYFDYNIIGAYMGEFTPVYDYGEKA